MPNTTSELYDPRQGDHALRLESIAAGPEAFEPARTNRFSLFGITEGHGTFSADSAHHEFQAPALLCFKPYQYIRLEPRAAWRADVIQFHANFLCVETFHAEVGCAGLLFNDTYGLPVVPLDEASRGELEWLVERIKLELARDELAREEILLAYMKVLLILATRQKSSLGMANGAAADPSGDPIFEELTALIEKHYQTLHKPADYARLLHSTPKTLGRTVRKWLGKTLGELIRERILTHAKWQLLHTLRPVKEIAREVGFQDELYFSRLFKKATGMSPTQFREFETEIRGGSNLSMFLGDSTIQETPTRSDNRGVRVKPSRRRKVRPRDST